MKSVFLDFATISNGDLDTRALAQAAPELALLDDVQQNEIIECIGSRTIVMTNKLRLDRSIIESAPMLRLIVLSATGTNNVDLEAARERGVTVCNVTDYCTPSVVQHVLGVLLFLTHQLAAYSREAIDGTWGQARHFTILQHRIRELRGCTLGVIGWGVLGQAVAAACEQALGMRVIIANRLGGAPTADRVELDALLRRADVVTLHCPLTPTTTGMIDRRRLELMKRDAILINTARGGLIDIAALADALRERRLGGAAIDVLPQEPPIDGSPLFAPDLPNLIVTPHIAWSAVESRQRCLDEMALNIHDWRAGGTRHRVV
ncbi:MAG: glycerate dehydrogenase [Gammaproteobacteria bacterium]|nr:glycerate dehydrogenase [Gammaproteobacteria bacterium]MBM4232579.1 glycerate dehydrogenase [Gammaproteobacteria bacterium]